MPKPSKKRPTPKSSVSTQLTDRVVVCIGVDEVGGYTELKGAAKDAIAFGDWAASQGCEVHKFTDDEDPVFASDISTCIKQLVEQTRFSHLILYFAGHGLILNDSEFWLLSRSQDDPNEAINLTRAMADAKRAGIPHVVFVSDSCRTPPSSDEFRRIYGHAIFPTVANRTPVMIDTIYAVENGDPAYEAKSDGRFQGILTNTLLNLVRYPDPGMIELSEKMNVIPVVNLAEPLRRDVVSAAAKVDPSMRHIPEVNHQSILPKYFARVPETKKPIALDEEPEIIKFSTVGNVNTPAPISDAFEVLKAKLDLPHKKPKSTAAALEREQELGLEREITALTGFQHHPEETGSFTGITVYGAPRHEISSSVYQCQEIHHVQRYRGKHWRLEPRYHDEQTPTVFVTFSDTGVGMMLPMIHGYICTLVVSDSAAKHVSYKPSPQNPIFFDYQSRAGQIELLKAYASVASQYGRFEVGEKTAEYVAFLFRQEKLFDPMLGLYAAYSYAQAGNFDEINKIIDFMLRDRTFVPFDLKMLAQRGENFRHHKLEVFPAAPMLSQGWSWLLPGDELHLKIHEELRAQTVKGLWTTYTAEGIRALSETVRSPAFA